MENNQLYKKLNDHSAHIVILGLGYVGLPLAAVLAEAGYKVTGVDPDHEKVALLNQGVSYIDDVKTSQVKKLVDGKKLKAQELPGLWNGAMADWNTIFVEVPIITFNPVKTINDFLRDEHQ